MFVGGITFGRDLVSPISRSTTADVVLKVEGMGEWSIDQLMEMFVASSSFMVEKLWLSSTKRRE